MNDDGRNGVDTFDGQLERAFTFRFSVQAIDEVLVICSNQTISQHVSDIVLDL
jgi:hypothetical protein